MPRTRPRLQEPADDDAVAFMAEAESKITDDQREFAAFQARVSTRACVPGRAGTGPGCPARTPARRWSCRACPVRDPCPRTLTAAQIAAQPAQCLRYCFDVGAQPLWPSSRGACDGGAVPDCPNCGAPRRFEFQVMPQLLNHLGLDHSAGDAPDWAAIAVYSCSRSCAAAEAAPSAYVEEYAWVQPPLTDE